MVYLWAPMVMLVYTDMYVVIVTYLRLPNDTNVVRLCYVLYYRYYYCYYCSTTATTVVAAAVVVLVLVLVLVVLVLVRTK